MFVILTEPLELEQPTLTYSKILQVMFTNTHLTGRIRNEEQEESY